MTTEILDLDRIKEPKDITRFLSGLPFIRAQASELKAEIVRARRELVRRLDAVQKRRESADAHDLTRKASEARSGVERARQAAAKLIADAETELYRASAAQFEFSSVVEREQNVVEKELRASADPRIGEFIEWALTEHASLLSAATAALERFHSHEDPVTEKKTFTRMFDVTPAQVEARARALLDATTAADLLRLRVDIDVEDEIARLKDAIPVVLGLTTIGGA